MRLNELVGKDIVDLKQGKKLGRVKEADIVFEICSGKIESIVLHNNHKPVIIPSVCIKQIGSRTIVVDI